MKIGVLFAFLMYYSLLGLFFYFASPYINTDGNYTSTIDIGNLNVDYRTGYYNIEVFYADFNWWTGGNSGWTTTPLLSGWNLVQNNEYCVDDNNDDCMISNDNPCQLYYNDDIDLSNCQAGIAVSGFVNGINFNGTQPIHLMLSNDSGNSYDDVYEISDGDYLGAWSYNINESIYGVETFKFGFNATDLDTGEHYYLDNIKIACQVTQEYLEDISTEQTSVSITSFFTFLGFGIGLPAETPTWFKVIFAVWQSIMTILFLAFLYQAIRGS